MNKAEYWAARENLQNKYKLDIVALDNEYLSSSNKIKIGDIIKNNFGDYGIVTSFSAYYRSIIPIMRYDCIECDANGNKIPAPLSSGFIGLAIYQENVTHINGEPYNMFGELND